MKLHSPQFEKALRQRIQRTVRSSPGLKREFRRAKHFRRNNRFRWLIFLWMTIPFGLFVEAARAATGHVATGLAIINLGMLGLLSVLAHGLRTRLQSSPENLALAFLPIPREKLFRWQVQKFFRNSLLWLPYLLAGFWSLACLSGFSPWKWAAILLIAVLSWAVLLATAVFCAARLPPSPFQIITAGLVLAVFADIFGKDLVRPMMLAALDQAAPELNLLLPTGWPVSLFQTLTMETPAWFLVLLLPIGVTFWAAGNSLTRLFANYHYREYFCAAAPDLVPNGGGSEETAPEKPSPLGTTAIEEIIQSRGFLDRPERPRRGWLEQRLWSWFSPREQALSDFAFPNGIALTKLWLAACKWFAISAAIALALGPVSPALQFWAQAIGLFSSLFVVLGVTTSPGRAFQPLAFSGVNIPMYAGYGIGFRELSRLLLKCSLIQLPILLTFALAAGAITAFVAGFPLGRGLIIGIKAGWLLFASRFILLTMSFSAGSNDTSRFRPRSILLLFSFVVFGLAFVGLGVGGLLYPEQPTAWLLCLGAAVDASVFFLVYQYFYIHGRFDLMSQPRN